MAAGDVSAPDDVSRSLCGCSQVVFRVALLTPACAAQARRGAQVNLLGTLNVRRRVTRASGTWSTSSAGVYGPDDATQPRPTAVRHLVPPKVSRGPTGPTTASAASACDRSSSTVPGASRISSGPSLPAALLRARAYTIRSPTHRAGLRRRCRAPRRGADTGDRPSFDLPGVVV
jgi:hypothetical protein